MQDFDLKRSSFAVGRLYPVLSDKHGNVIDGRHRLAFDPTWPKLRLDHIESEKDRTLVRLISNVCRRDVSGQEKRELLKKLGEIYLREGEEKKNVANRISQETGMTYRWVMKYLPSHLKTRPGLGGPSRHLLIDGHEKCFDIGRVEHRSTGSLRDLLSDPQEKVVIVKTFANTNFVNLVFDKHFYERLEKSAQRLGISTETVINNAMITALKEIESMTRLMIVS